MLIEGKYINIRTTVHGRTCALHLKGRIDATTANAFDTACQAALDAKAKGIIIDMQEITYVSSAGLRSILILQKACTQKQCRLVFCALQNSVTEVFEVSAFDRILSISPNLKQALQDIGTANA